MYEKNVLYSIQLLVLAQTVVQALAGKVRRGANEVRAVGYGATEVGGRLVQVARTDQSAESQ